MAALTYCIQTLKTCHTTNPGITETIRNTEAILEAGNSQPNAGAVARQPGANSDETNQS